MSFVFTKVVQLEMAQMSDEKFRAYKSVVLLLARSTSELPTKDTKLCPKHQRRSSGLPIFGKEFAYLPKNKK